MNDPLLRLLKDYLRRSAGLWIPLALAQYAVVATYWWLHIDRAPLLCALIGLAGAVNALDPNSLVWRSVPLPATQAAALRWWATAGFPGILSTLCYAVVALDHWLTGSNAAAPGVAIESALAAWAALGFIAVLPHRALTPTPRERASRALLLIAALFFPLGYGLPLDGPVVGLLSALATLCGLVLLAIAAIRVRFANAWRWPQPALSRDRARVTAAAYSTQPTGWLVLLLPLIRRTTILAVAAISAISVLRLIFPDDTVALSWVYVIGVCLWGFVITWRQRSAVHVLRCMPIGVNALALAMQASGVFPSVVVFSLTVLVNRAIPMLAIDMPLTMPAVFLFSQLTFHPNGQNFQNWNRYRRQWFLLLQRLFTPLWLGFCCASLVGRGYPPWTTWLLAAVGVGLCLASHQILVRSLHAGIRPGRGPQDMLTA